MKQIAVSITNSFRYQYGNKNLMLKAGTKYYLDIDKIAERKELLYMLSGTFPFARNIAIEYNQYLLELFNISKMDVGTVHPDDPETGRFYLNTALGKVFYFNGRDWIDWTGGGGGGTSPITIIPQLFGDVYSTGFSNEVNITPGAIVDADISPSAAIQLSKLAVDPLNRANHTGVQPSSTIIDFDARVRMNRLDQFLPPASSLSMSNFRVLDVATPIANTDAANKAYVDAAVKALRLNDLLPPTANYDMAGFGLTSLKAPVNPGDAVNKAYVDALALGSSNKLPVRLVATGNVSPMSGTGQTIDGRTVVAGDSVLLNGQSDPRLNGIYVVSAGAWVRRSDANTNSTLTTGTQVFATDGATLAGSGWVMTTPNGPTSLGVSQIYFTQFTGLGMVNAGDGLVFTAGSTVNAVGTPNRIVVFPDSIDIASNYAGQPSISILGAVTSGTWQASPINVQYGGTGATNAADARTNLGAAKSGANSDITSLNGLTTPISIPQGGTGATTALDARFNLQAAKSGVNTDITQLAGLTTPLTITQGGTGATDANTARANLQAAKSGVNSDITQLAGLTVPISVTQGGTGATNAAGARVNLGAVGDGLNLGLSAGPTVGQIFHSVQNTGSDVVMRFRSLVEGPGIDIIQNANDITIGINPASLITTINLASQVTGVLPLANGGTGVSATSNGNLLQQLGAVYTAASLGGTSIVGPVPTTPIANQGLQINLRGLTEGAGINLTQGATDITVDVDAVNVGAGRRVLVTPLSTSSGPLSFRSLLPGAGVTIVEGTNDITISSVVNGANVGTGSQVLQLPVVGNSFNFRTLLAGTGIVVTQGANEITFTPNIANAANVGAGEKVLVTPIVVPGATLNFKSLIAGVGLTAVSTATDITFKANIADATNVGGAAEVLKTPLVTPGATLEHRTLLDGNGILFTQLPDNIKADFNATNLGSGLGVLALPLTPVVGFKSIKAGLGITATATATEITVNALIADAINVGAGRQILVTPIAPVPGGVLNIRSLVQGVGIQLVQNANDITVTPMVANADNLAGTGARVLSNGPVTVAGTTITFRRIAAVDSSVVVTEAASAISLQGAIKDAVNLGSGTPILSTPITYPGATLGFKTLLEGNGINYTSSANDVTITVDAVNLGSGAQVLVPGATLGFRSVIGTSGITATQNANDITLALNAANVGTGEGVLVTPISGAVVDFKSIKALAGITVTSTATEVQIQAALSSAANVGAGRQVLQTPIVGGALNFRTLVEGDGINLTQGTNDITVAVDAVSLGSGTALVVPGVTLGVKSLIAGPGVTLTSTATDVTINGSLAGAVNVGSGSQVLQTPLTPVPGSILSLRSIVGTSGIVATQNASDITLTISATNLGTGIPVLKTPVTGPSLQALSILSGKGVTASLSASSNEVQLDANTANLGAVGAAVLANPGAGAAGPLNFRKIESSDSSVSVTQTTNTVDLKILGAVKKFSTTANIPTTTPVTINHNLGTTDYIVDVRDDMGGGVEVPLTGYNLSNITSTSVDISFAPAAAPGACRVIVIG